MQLREETEMTIQQKEIVLDVQKLRLERDELALYIHRLRLENEELKRRLAMIEGVEEESDA